MSNLIPKKWERASEEQRQKMANELTEKGLSRLPEGHIAHSYRTKNKPLNPELVVPSANPQSLLNCLKDPTPATPQSESPNSPVDISALEAELKDIRKVYSKSFFNGGDTKELWEKMEHLKKQIDQARGFSIGEIKDGVLSINANQATFHKSPRPTQALKEILKAIGDREVKTIKLDIQGDETYKGAWNTLTKDVLQNNLGVQVEKAKQEPVKVELPKKLVMVDRSLYWVHEKDGKVMDAYLCRTNIVLPLGNDSVHAFHPITKEKIYPERKEAKELGDNFKRVQKTSELKKLEYKLAGEKSELEYRQKNGKDAAGVHKRANALAGKIEKLKLQLAKLPEPTEKIDYKDWLDTLKSRN